MDVQLPAHIFNDDRGPGVVCNNHMERRWRAESLVNIFVVNNPEFRECVLDLINGFKLAQNISTLIDIIQCGRFLTFFKSLVFGKARKVQDTHRQAGFVHSIHDEGFFDCVYGNEAIFILPGHPLFTTT